MTGEVRKLAQEVGATFEAAHDTLAFRARWAVDPDFLRADSVKIFNDGVIEYPTQTASLLQPGIYDVTVAKAGFVTHVVTHIQVLSSQTVRVDVKLTLGAMQQTVSVSGEVALVHTDTQTISSSISTRVMGDLPKSSQSIDTLIGLVAILARPR